MKSLLILGLALFSICQSANAVTVNIDAGDYYTRGYFNDYYGNKPDFKIARKGNQFRLLDPTNNLVYGIDFDSTAEQDISAKYLQYLKDNPYIVGGAFARILKRATISDIRASSDPAKTLMNINLYLDMKSVFGSLTAKIQIANAITAKKCEVRVTSYANNNYKEDKVQTTCIIVQPAIDASLVELNTGLGADLNKGLGLVLDTVVRMVSINLSQPIKLYEHP